MGSELQSQQLVSKFDEEEVPVGSVILVGLPLEYPLLCCSVCSEFFQRVETQQCHSCSACACIRAFALAFASSQGHSQSSPGVRYRIFSFMTFESFVFILPTPLFG